ncbi:vanillate O-demethylase ferredoxin subunit [Variovorax paradoxus]|uniref:Vanillate O-demethylase ferredoxin subunit n=1 Tax=Variovorax paradoxus TaxID=34073 RepID=A0AAW8E9J1_VARPD|nr:PDR/VanB family oxidoreductase [Variovorax paradoxus]MDP9968856.1 vanillate O-demethylase ferredoxin subunit [Variovorax paradoxus]
METSALTVGKCRKLVEALDICTFEFVHVEGKPLSSFSAGSHVDVHLPNSLTRQYSLCNDPSETHRYLIGVLNDPGSRGGSKAMHDMVSEGDTLSISLPKNHFPLTRGARSSLLLAGGIGITPILCMAERLAIAGEDFAMHYAARSRERMAFQGRIRQSSFSSRSAFHFDDGDDAQKLDLDSLLDRPSSDVHLYVCGPKGFMDAVLATARAKAWPEKQLHYEFFAGKPIKADGDGSFAVKLASSGKLVLVPRDKTVVQALSEAGIVVPTSCEQGVCGTCLTRVLEGVSEHRDMYLTPGEQAMNDQFLPCCSRAKSAALTPDM